MMNKANPSQQYPSSFNGGQPLDDNETRLGEEHRRPLDPGRQDGSDDGAPAPATDEDADEQQAG
jgi:hypothetical protein